MTTVTTVSAGPRIGYLLTAAFAGRRYSAAADMWNDLDEATQADVIVALGGQARLAVAEAGVPLQVDFTSLADARCPEAQAATESAYAGCLPAEVPQCPDCRELVASALAEIHLKAAVAAGLPPSYVDLMCRGKAVEVAA